MKEKRDRRRLKIADEKDAKDYKCKEKKKRKKEKKRLWMRGRKK